jgi:hypothetical protein
MPIFLHGCGPSVEPTSATYPTCKATLFDESHIGYVTGQEDLLLLSGADDHDFPGKLYLNASSSK